jgi:hypothetical protein
VLYCVILKKRELLETHTFSWIFRSAGAQSSGCAHRGRVCVYVFIGVSVRAVVSVCVVLYNFLKKETAP